MSSDPYKAIIEEATREAFAGLADELRAVVDAHRTRPATPLDPARRLVTLPGWEWVRGMALIGPGAGMIVRVAPDDDHPERTCLSVREIPDLGRGLVQGPDGWYEPWWNQRPIGVAVSAPLPDLEDDATRGIVLGMLSRRVGGYAWIEPTGWRSGVLTWDARCQMPHGTRRLIASGASWAEAFVAAWEATDPMNNKRGAT